MREEKKLTILDDIKNSDAKGWFTLIIALGRVCSLCAA